MPKRSRVSIDRCVPGSKRRIDSTVSPMNSIRIGSSSPAETHRRFRRGRGSRRGHQLDPPAHTAEHQRVRQLVKVDVDARLDLARRQEDRGRLRNLGQ
jgi:hypothetical protein